MVVLPYGFAFSVRVVSVCYLLFVSGLEREADAERDLWFKH
jgi:hypothetical protein